MTDFETDSPAASVNLIKDSFGPMFGCSGL